MPVDFIQRLRIKSTPEIRIDRMIPKPNWKPASTPRYRKVTATKAGKIGSRNRTIKYAIDRLFKERGF